MNDPVRVTVLVPTFNASEYLEQALRSAVESDLRELGVEILVLDGVSTDATERIARSFGPPVHFSAVRDKGMYDALNRGLAMARGEVIGWLNADDMYAREGLKQLVSALLDDPALDVVYGDYRLLKASVGRHEVQVHADDAWAAMRRGEGDAAWVTPLATFWRARTLRALGGWDSSYRLVADYRLWIRAACHEPALRSRHLPIVAGDFRIHAGSLTTGGGQTERVLRETLRMWEEGLRHRPLPEGVETHLRNARRQTLSDWLWNDLKRRNWAGTRERAALLAADPAWPRAFVSRVALHEGRDLGERYVPRRVYLLLRDAYRAARDLRRRGAETR